MKALVLTGYNRFAYQDIPMPAVGAGEVLVHVKSCGICGSDVHGMDGSTGRRKPPIVMGHEAAGIIAELGHGVTGLQEGDRVTFDSTIYCGECWYCRRGQINLCDNRRVLGVSCDEYSHQGALAEYISVPQRIVYRLPESVSFDQAAMVEPLSVAVHAVDITRVPLGCTAAVIGTGVIGLLLVQVLRAAGCGWIAAVDIDGRKLDLAVKLGADVGLNPRESDVVRQVENCTHGRGADMAFEAVGITDTVKTAVRCLRKGGTLTLVGNVSPTVDVPLQSIVTRQIQLKGSCASSGEYPTCLDMIAKRRVCVDTLISATPPLREGGAWFERLYKKEGDWIKVILKP